MKEYFFEGQFVSCTVVGKDHLESKQKSNTLRLSLSPSDINTNLHSSDIKKGMLLWGTISSEEDHGYEVSFGSKLLKGFLKS